LWFCHTRRSWIQSTALVEAQWPWFNPNGTYVTSVRPISLIVVQANGVAVGDWPPRCALHDIVLQHQAGGHIQVVRIALPAQGVVDKQPSREPWVCRVVEWRRSVAAEVGGHRHTHPCCACYQILLLACCIDGGYGSDTAAWRKMRGFDIHILRRPPEEPPLFSRRNCFPRLPMKSNTPPKCLQGFQLIHKKRAAPSRGGGGGYPHPPRVDE
jgi:hypothetical protein